ncbi:MAG: acetate--CoA ligase [Candidatus Melainabacteria bacterium]|jgi:acetyl-CoA synthetase|nr:acetate--CoA ligase [Candidatus Melainabacteria bacterium]MBX9673998.1 acetate--CoA ligase [Candidatus Obscuribacterales bacterium]
MKVVEKKQHAKKTEKPKGAKREILKKAAVNCNLPEYENFYNTFSWQDAQKEISYFFGGKVNAAYNAVDRHLHNGRRNKVALYSVDARGHLEKYTFQEIYEAANRLGNALKSLGVKRGDRVFVFLPRIFELYVSTIAIAKIGAIAGPLFSAFGPDALRDRLHNSEATIVITNTDLKDKIDAIRRDLPDLEHVIVIGPKQDLDGAHASRELGEGELDYAQLIEGQSSELICEQMDPEDPLYLLYTSGTTGKPKGVVHVHGDIIGQHMTSKWVLDLKEDDVYWCTADPGWVTGTVYGIFGPWSNGASVVSYEGRFDAASWYKLIDRLKVTVWYTAPTALRMLMKAGDDVVFEHDLGSLRHVLSVGEPLNPEVVRWGMKVFGLPIHDNWWQTETGMQLIANLPCNPLKPGSMGKPLPGVYAAIVDDQGQELDAGELGRLVVKPGWPAMLRRIWRNKDKFDEYFKIPGWYFSGDNAWKDEEGYFWFVGRADDVINTSGHRVGPFEVESALVEHPAVAEAGVIGKPDKERGEIIKAFIVLANGVTMNDNLLNEIKDHTRKTLAAHAYPREIEVKDSLPKTRSGKIMRRLLKAWELGLPTGDVSSLEDD